GYAQNNPETLKDPTGRYTVTTISDQHCISSGCYSLTVRKLELSGWMDFGLTALALVIATGVCLLTVDPVCGWVVFVISAVIALGYVLFSASDGNLYFYWAHVDKFFTYFISIAITISYTLSYTISYTVRGCAWFVCWSYTVSYQIY